jgi:hypothetical protein
MQAETDVLAPDLEGCPAMFAHKTCIHVAWRSSLVRGTRDDLMSERVHL